MLMLTFRAKIFIVVSAVLLVFLSVSVFLLIMGKNKEAAAPVGQTETPGVLDKDNFDPNAIGTKPLIQAPAGTPVAPLTTAEVWKNAARQMAKIFTERYGTFSSDNESANIRELEPLVTPNFWRALSGKIKPAASGEFYGVTTVAAASDFIEYGETEAKISVTTQRTETKGAVVSEKNQKAEVTLIKSGEQWLVSGFEWK